MKNYCALISENIVSEIIVADYSWVQTNLSGNWHDLGAEPLTVAVGWIYDPATGSFSPPSHNPIPE